MKNLKSTFKRTCARATHSHCVIVWVTITYTFACLQYGVILLLLLIIEVVFIVLTFVYKSYIADTFKDKLADKFREYESHKNMLDDIQRHVSFIF